MRESGERLGRHPSMGSRLGPLAFRLGLPDALHRPLDRLMVRTDLAGIVAYFIFLPSLSNCCYKFEIC